MMPISVGDVFEVHQVGVPPFPVKVGQIWPGAAGKLHYLFEQSPPNGYSSWSLTEEEIQERIKDGRYKLLHCGVGPAYFSFGNTGGSSSGTGCECGLGTCGQPESSSRHSSWCRMYRKD
jgi:hypothetical protein